MADGGGCNSGNIGAAKIILNKHVYENIQGKFQAWKQAIRRISPNNLQETDKNGNLYHSEDEQQAKDVLLALLNGSNALNDRIVALAQDRQMLGLQEKEALQLVIDGAALAIDDVFGIK